MISTPAPDLIAEVKIPGDVVFPGDTAALHVPRALSHELKPDGILAVSGKLADPRSSGRTGGLSFRLTDELERRVSGKTIRIHIVAEAEREGEAFLAYSTNEVGNSGWMPFAVGPTETITVLRYRVPPLSEGNGDFIGIDPNDHMLTIKTIVVEIANPD